MHYIEDIFVLTADHYADLIADFRKFFRESRGIFVRFTGICNHHHVKIPLYDSLGNNVNILDISQTILDGIFDMVLICDMENAKGSLKQVQDDMGELGRELGVDVRVQLADIFYAMHRI